MVKIIPEALKLTSPAQLEAEIERRKSIDQERQALFTRLEKIADRLPGMVFQFQYFLDERRSKFLYCSEGVRNVYDLTVEEVLKEDANKLFNLIYPDDYEFVMNKIVESAKTLELHHYQFRIQLENGDVRWLMVNAKPEQGDDAATTLWHGFIYDITDQKAAEETVTQTCAINQDLENLVRERTLKLQELNDSLAESIEKEVQNNREKDGMLIQQSRLAAMGEMMNNIAHQWRQPLNALNLVLANIEDAHRYEQLTDEYLTQQIAKGDQLIQTMSNTIDDFRVFFKTDGTQETFDVGAALQDTLDIVEASFKNNNIKIEIVADEFINVYAFKGQYRQVMLNILGNAKEALIERHIPNGKVVITLSQEQQLAVVRIQDNAGGIKDDIIQKIFDPYFTTRPQGNGIGLYMSKMIIENNMHGELSVQNTDEGAAFVIKVKMGN
jgi:PAS domain S-box-containing protein